MRRIGCIGIELLGTLPFIGHRLLVLAAVVEGLELFKDEVKSILLDVGLRIFGQATLIRLIPQLIIVHIIQESILKQHQHQIHRHLLDAAHGIQCRIHDPW